MKRLIASVIVVVAFTFYAIFTRGGSTTQNLANAGGAGTGSASGTATTLPVASGGEDDESGASPQTATPVASAVPTSGYVDGTYTGSQANALYGVVQVKVVVQGGQIADIQFLSHPTGNHSNQINDRATPALVQEAIANQSANVQVVSGATLTSRAFMESLQSALNQAA
jgi:uncharacterized protein with FMN-binding domain